jgi:peptidoglycan/LPS O-acetylase OafA/YrhL
MFGLYRLSLAVLVAISHMGFSIAGYHLGVMAVMGFYVLAGYIAAALWQRAEQYPNAARYYWKGRFWRLMPLYWGMVVLTAILMPYLAPSEFLSAPLDGNAWLQNLLVFPLAYYPLSGIDKITLIPPAWSLAVEFHYYLFIPLLAYLSERWIRFIWLLSLLIWLASFTDLLDTERWGYRYFLGMLFVFLTGRSLWFARQQALLFSLESKVVLVLLLILLAWINIYQEERFYFQMETVLGLLIAIPMISALATLPRHHWDDFLGKPAYLIFLGHFLLYWILTGSLI